MTDTRKSCTYHQQNALPALHDGLTFPDFLKIRPPSFSPLPTVSTDLTQSRYETPKTNRPNETQSLAHLFLPPKPTIPLPVTPTQEGFYEIVVPAKGRVEALVDSKDGSYVRSHSSVQSSGRCSDSNRLSSGDTSYVQRSSSSTDRRSFMRSSNNEFSVLQNDPAILLMGSSSEGRDDSNNRCFQNIYSHGRRPSSNRQKARSPTLGSKLFNKKTAVIYFVCLILLLLSCTILALLKSTKQYVYSSDDLIMHASPHYFLKFGVSSDFVLPSRQITYFELAIQYDTNLALLFNVSDSQARFVVYARQTLPPTPTFYSHRRIVTAEHLHHRSSNSKTKRSAYMDNARQILEEFQVRNSLINMDEIKSGKWYFGFLNDNTASLSIRLTPVATPSNKHETTKLSHGCKFDCFGKGTCIRDQCVCYPGYSGLFCQETLCPVLCSNNGVFSNGRCVCHENFRGPVCDEIVNMCPNGHCASIENQVPEALNANRTFVDAPLQTLVPKTTIPIELDNEQSDCAKECEEHGSCINGSCVCHKGWTGDDCLTRGCENDCSSNGVCQLVGSEYKCFCNNTYFGPNCQYPLETECSDDIDNDGDDLIDCADSECCSSPHCSNHPLCLSDLQKFSVPRHVRTSREVSFRKQITFLLDPDLGQKYADSATFDDSRIAVIRGRVMSRRAGPLTGVRISNLLNAKQGFTLTRSTNGGGSFNFVCNGGGFVRLSFLRHPFGAVERSFFIPNNEIFDVGEIFMDEEANATVPSERCRSAYLTHRFTPKVFTTPLSSDNFDLSLSDGSRIDVEHRSLEVRTTIESANRIQLVYNSDRSTQARSALYIQLLDGDLPSNLQLVHLWIRIAGLVFEREFSPKPGLQYNFEWDRLNVYGQHVIGLANANVEILYEYKNCSKDFVRFVQNVQLEGRHLLRNSDLGLWTLNIQHHYDWHNRILERGDGKRVYLDKTPFTIRTLIGSSVQRSEVCSDCQNQAVNGALLHSPSAIVNLPDGSIVFSDHNLIRRFAIKEQRVETLLELTAENIDNCHLALDSASNEVYVALRYQVLKLKKLERVRDPKTNYRVVTGTGERCEADTDCSNGNDKAKSVRFHELRALSFDKNGGFYLADGRTIRHVSRQGKLQNLVAASDWRWTFECPSKFRLELLNLERPLTLIVQPVTQDLFVLDLNAIYRIDVKQSMVQLLAGNLHNCDFNNQAVVESLNNPKQMALDVGSGYLYLTESDGKRLHRVRRVSTNGGGLEEVAGRVGNCDCNRKSCPCDEHPDKKFLLARDALFYNLTGISVDIQGRLYVVDSGNYKIKVIGPMQPEFDQKHSIYQINSPDSNSIYEFDQTGRHLQTKTLFDNRSKHVFVYSASDQRLVNIRVDRMNLTFSTHDSSIIARNSYSQETTIQTKLADTNEHTQLYAVSDWRGVHSMFEYEATGQLINKTKIWHKIAVIAYDSAGQAASIEDVASSKRFDFDSPGFDDSGKLRFTIKQDGQEFTVMQQLNNDLLIRDSCHRHFAKRWNGFEVQDCNYHYFYERASHPFVSANDSFTIRHRFVYPDVEKPMSKVTLRYELQTVQRNSQTQQTIKLNGQKYLSRVFDSETLTHVISDPSENDLLMLQLDPTNTVTNVRFGSGQTIDFEYNEIGQLERAKWMNRTLFNIFDEQHRLIQQIIKGLDVELSRSFGYDRDSFYPSTMRINNGAEYQLGYEVDGRLRSVRSPSGSEYTFNLQVDSDSVEITFTLPSGHQLKTTYNLDNQLVQLISGVEGKMKWSKDRYGHMTGLVAEPENCTYQCEYKSSIKVYNGVSSHTFDRIVQGPLVRAVKQSFKDGANSFLQTETVYTYDDSKRVSKVENLIGQRKVGFTRHFSYDFMSRPTKIGNAVVIHTNREVQIIHPNVSTCNLNEDFGFQFELLLSRTVDGNLERIEFRSSSDPKNISGRFVYDSLSQVSESKWQVDGNVDDIEAFNYVNGRLSSFNLNGVSYEVGYDNNGRVTRVANNSIEYTVDGGVKSFADETWTTNQLGWTTEQKNLIFAYDTLGQLLELTDKISNTTFKYIYDDKQRLIRRVTNSADYKNVTFYYDHSNDLDLLSHFVLDNDSVFVLHHHGTRPFLLEQPNGSVFALLTDSLGSVRKIVDSHGNVVESRSYNPFGSSSVIKSWSGWLPIGYMGFIEDTGIVFVYDKQKRITRPLNTRTGCFQTGAVVALKTEFDLLNLDTEMDPFGFDHGRSLKSAFPTDAEQWLQLAGIHRNLLTSNDPDDCGQLASIDTVCTAKQTANFLPKMFDLKLISPFLAPVQ